MGEGPYPQRAKAQMKNMRKVFHIPNANWAMNIHSTKLERKR